MDSAAEPDLAPPGAGVTFLERKLLTWAVGWRARQWSVAEALRRFLEGADRFLERIGPLDEATGRRRVLIPRRPWLEDSSRYYSPYMVLQHVAMVDRGGIGLVVLLAAGRTSDRQASTAAVKPAPDAGPETLETFRQVREQWRERLAGIERLPTAARHAHPWTGPLDAHRWLCLSVLHHDIHLRQLDRILAG